MDKYLLAKNNKGLGLIVVLGIILLIFSLAVFSIVFSLSNYTLFASYVDSSKAFYFAEAGIQKAMYEIKNDTIPPAPHPDWTFTTQAKNPVKITITADVTMPNTYNVTAENTYNSKTKRITAKILKNGPSVKLLEWGQSN